jgi:hypothetical protein
MTLVAPNWLGAISGDYKGPENIGQYYFYAGLLVLPLAAIGAVKTKMRLFGVLLILPSAWYMLGPGGGLYYLGALVPTLHTFRAPVEGWFLVALGLALLAAAGSDWVFVRWHIPYLRILVVGLLFVDVWYWNSLKNPLAYARSSFDDLYGSSEEAGYLRVARSQPPLTRFDAPRDRAAMGPKLHPLDLKLEATYGSLGLELSAYGQYIDAMQRNPKLRDALNVSRFLNVATGHIDDNSSMLPRAYFPKTVVDVNSPAESRQALETLDPAARSIVLSPHPPIHQDPDAAALADNSGEHEQWYHIHYHAVSPSLLILSTSWYPGWHAEVDAKPLPVLRVNHALVGVVVPAGDSEVAFNFHSNRFGSGLAISLLSGLVLIALVRGGRRHRRRKHKRRKRSKRVAW